MKTFFKDFIILVVTAAVVIFIVSLFAPKSQKIEYGVTFSAPYATSLGLDWKTAYLAVLDELKPKYIRLSAYWDTAEPQKDGYDFTSSENNIDFQIQQAEERNIKVVLAVGRRLPRWPECHDPSWIKDLSDDVLANAQLSYVETTVSRYQNYSNIIAWQVENEPFLSTFGECPKLDKTLLDREIALVKKLDPARPVIITDSGELSWWFSSGARGDIFGTTFYRYVFSDVFKRYWTNHIPVIYYRFRAGILRILHPGKDIQILELEAEPWTTAGITSTSIDDQFKTMSLNNFNAILDIAAQTKFSPQYLWGAEWWYWMKQNNHSEFWEKAKQLFQQ